MKKRETERDLKIGKKNMVKRWKKKGWQMIDKKWEKIENLHRHRALTSRVKMRLRKEREILEKRLVTINVLLEKPVVRSTIKI